MNRKTAVIGIVCIAVIGAGAAYLLREKEPDILPQSFVSEYGQPISTDVNDYFLIEDPDAQASIEIEGYNPNGDGYPPVGTYTGILTVNGKKGLFSLDVRDTTPPKWVKFEDELTVHQNHMDINLAEYFKATDISGDVAVSFGEFTLLECGEQTVTVTAVDRYGNQTQGQFILNVVSDEETNA